MDYEGKTKEELVRELECLRGIADVNEERWRFALEGSGMGVWDWNIQTNEVFYSPQCKAMLGFADHEMSSYLDAWHQRIHPEDLRRVMNELERHVKGESTLYAAEYRIRCKDGSYRWVAGRGKIMTRSEMGKPVRMVGVHMDITERVRQEEALKESENKFRDLSEKSEVGIFLLQERQFRYINQKFAEIHGYSMEEILYRKRPKDFIHPDDLPGLKEKTLKTLSGEMETFHHEFRIVTGTGAVRRIEVYYSRTIFEGKPGLVGTVLDVTERRMLEDRYLKSQKMEVIAMLAGSIAHDYNNLLTSIIGHAALLDQEYPAGGKGKHHVARILASAERATELTRNLLSLSRTQPMQIRPKKVGTAIRASQELIARLLGGDIKLSVSIQADPTIMVDVAQLEMLLINLARRARGEMPGGGQFRIEIAAAEINREFILRYGYGKPGRYATISLSDSGAGMDREAIATIFQPFSLSPNAGITSGVALSTVYAIVKQHGGYIRAESAPEAGTAFHVYFPIHEQAAESPETVIGEVRRGTETILLAEDYEEVRLLLKEILEGSGYQVIDAADGEEAIRKFSDAKDVIRMAVLDVIMPRKNGREVYQAIRRIKPEVKVLFASGYTGEISLIEDIRKHDVEFLPKPLKPEILLAKVRSMLDQP